jgi:hypothetical protein
VRFRRSLRGESTKHQNAEHFQRFYGAIKISKFNVRTEVEAETPRVPLAQCWHRGINATPPATEPAALDRTHKWTASETY